jgi:hypothetical protein
VRLLTILLRHGVDQYADAECRLQALLQAQVPAAQRDLLVVDNALAADVVDGERLTGDPAAGTVRRALIAGDNRVREFTGFDRALQWLGPQIERYDLVHFATSAFETLYTAYLQRFSDRALDLVAAAPACLGHIDCYNEPVRLGVVVSQHWIRSCWFMLAPSQVRALGRFAAVRDRDAFFSADPAAPFRPDAPVSLTYQRYITEWLTGGDIGQGVEWHSAAALTPERLPAFEVKTLCIFNEHLLASRLRALGCRLIDVTWLDTRLAAGEPVDWNTPWRAQLAGRDRDRVYPPT